MKKVLTLGVLAVALALAGTVVIVGCSSDGSPTGPSTKSIIRDAAGAPAANAPIFIDGVQVGSTDAEGEIMEPLTNPPPPGFYSAIVRTASGEEISIEIIVEADGDAELAGDEDSVSEASADELSEESVDELSEESVDEASEESVDEASEESVDPV